MLQLSTFPFKTQKTIPSGSDNRGTGLLLQAGMIRMTMAGAYNYTTLGLKVLKKIENIVREEMDNIGSQEILMTALASKENWEQTGRWNEVDVLFKLPATEGREYALNPTHEEIVTPLVGEFIQSYKDLEWCSVYQIQNKFRNEKRAKSGLLRGREFVMKDMYSFHRTQEELDEYFEIVHNAYNRVFERLGLGDVTHYTFASGWDFSKYSYEFQTELEIGEDEIFICKKCGQAHNLEIIDPQNFACVQCEHNEYDKKIVSETANIFKLGSRFSDAFDLKYQDENGKIQKLVMWCYGIGISRLMGVIAEKFATEKGIKWPKSVAPYDVYILILGEENLEIARKIAEKLESEGKTVILDDRIGSKFGFGQKAADCELWGIPTRIAITPKTIEKGGYEIFDGENTEFVNL